MCPQGPNALKVSLFHWLSIVTTNIIQLNCVLITSAKYAPQELVFYFLLCSYFAFGVDGHIFGIFWMIFDQNIKTLLHLQEHKAATV